MAQRTRGRLSLRHNFLWTFLGSIVENGAKWAMFIVLTKQASPAAVGTFSLALAVATPVNILAQLQLRVALITDTRDEYPFGAYLAMRMVAMALSMLAILGIAAATYGLGATTALIALIGLAQAVVSLRDIWVGLAQKHERMDVTAYGGMIDGIVSLVLFSAAILVTGSVLWGACALIMAHVITLVGYDMRRVRAVVDPALAIAPLWELHAMRRLFWAVLPLGLTTALVSLNSNIPRYFIEHSVGRDDLGYFAAIAYFVFAAQLIVGSLSRAASPRLAALYRQDRRQYGALLGKLVLIGGGLGMAGVLMALIAGKPFLRLMYSSAYAEESHILVLLMAAGGILYINSFFGMAISAARFFRLQTLTYIVVALTTVIACWILIPRLGLEGAAWAGIVSATVNTLINGVVVMYVHRHAPEAREAREEARAPGS